MNTSDHSNANDSARLRSTRRAYRERNAGTSVLFAFLLLLIPATVVIVKKEEKDPWWPWILFLSVFVVLFPALLLVWREVTVDVEAQVTREAWRLLGVLTVWKRQRSLGEFAAVRSQRVEVVAKGDRRVYCDVYLVAAVGAAKRLDVERFEMGEEGGSPEGVAVGLDLARLTGLPFEDKC